MLKRGGTARIGLIVAALAVAACLRSSPEVVVYTSEDQVFSEPVLKDFEKTSGIKVRALYDTEETKSTGVALRLVAERDRPQADVFWANEPLRTVMLQHHQGRVASRSAAKCGHSCLRGGPMYRFRGGARVGVHTLTACLLLVGLFAPTRSWAYRPFISTDAAVTEPKEVEIEVGYFTLERQKGENVFVIPRVVLNYGLFKNWEAVAEFAVRRSPDAEMNLIDPAIFLKGVLKEGVLQEKEGIGVAVEVGPLLPSTEKGERHVGFEGIGILTGKLGPLMVHVNGGLGVERSTGDVVGIWGVIGELPIANGLRIVGEVNGEKPRREDQRDSALLGAIWQPWSSKKVWFDAGVRRGFTSGVPDWQFTLGVTFGFSMSSLAPSLSSLAGIRER